MPKLNYNGAHGKKLHAGIYLIEGNHLKTSTIA
jgi:hypothetical protein